MWNSSEYQVLYPWSKIPKNATPGGRWFVPSQIDIILTPKIYPDNDRQKENNKPLDVIQDEEESEDSDGRDNSSNDLQSRDRGRPKILKIGNRGRSKKQYHVASCIEETDVIAYNAEIPLEQALHGPHAEEWLQALTSEMTSIIKNWDVKNRWQTDESQSGWQSRCTPQ